MLIRDLFVKDVTRDIPPVVYFHEQTPAKLADEVSEYIITGGYPESDPRHRRVKEGIHEEFVKLLLRVRSEFDRPGGPELPACWISGFYGSGKSSFAKLLGLALDGVVLPDGTPLSQALIARDDSPGRQQLVLAWENLRTRVDPIAVVFDIGAVARDDEHIHSAAVRQLQARLGYCSKNGLVARYELKLERDGDWDQFLLLAEQTLHMPWSRAKDTEQAEDHFSHVLHKMFPDRYQDPTTWFDSHAGAKADGLAVTEAVDLIEAMLAIRAQGKALFLVIDEVSQYVHQDLDRMLKLQSLVSALGHRMKGGAWIFCTGQQKLEDSGDSNVGKLKDRFPVPLRVHLAATNIRDVVHKRLLKKAPDHEQRLRTLFLDNRSDLRNNAYLCDDVTPEDFVEVYPMLPGYVDLMLEVTSNLRAHSTRMQGDDHAIRGLLQLLGELFRTQHLADREVGALVSLDEICDVQRTALDVDVQNTLHQVENHPVLGNNDLAKRAAKAVALLEQVQDRTPTTPLLVAQCLYREVGQGSQRDAVRDALEHLRAENFLGYSEKLGYKLQSSAGQEWQSDRDKIGATGEAISEVVREKLKFMMGRPELPRMKGRPFPWAAVFTDSLGARDVRILDPRDDSALVIDFRYLTNRADRDSPEWSARSAGDTLRDRLLWVAGDPGRLPDLCRDLIRSKRMVDSHQPRRESLTHDKQRLLIEEQTRVEELESRVRDAVEEAFLAGTFFFRGHQGTARDQGTSFPIALNARATRVLPELFPHFTETAVTDRELEQLFLKDLMGPSAKFLEDGLGILSLDGGRYVATCQGPVPRRILDHIEKNNGVSGGRLLSDFGKPPYGYPVDVTKACLVGLLRGQRIRIRPEEGKDFTSIGDKDIRELFHGDRALRRSDVFPAGEDPVGPRDRVAICQFFERSLGVVVQREKEAIVDAVFDYFPGKRAKLTEVETLLNRIPGRPDLPDALVKLGRALEDCRRSRFVEDVSIAVKKNLDALRDGMEQLGIYLADLNDDAIEGVRQAALVRANPLEQLQAIDQAAEVEEAGRVVIQHLSSDRPWREINSLAPHLAAIRARYAEVRRSMLARQAAAVEAARVRIKGRDGFEKLSADTAHTVLRPLTDALFDTTPEAVQPTLADMRDRFPGAIERAEAVANDRFDDAMEGLIELQTVKVDLGLKNRVIRDERALHDVLVEIEERVTAKLKDRKLVRLV